MVHQRKRLKSEESNDGPRFPDSQELTDNLHDQDLSPYGNMDFDSHQVRIRKFQLYLIIRRRTMMSLPQNMMKSPNLFNQGQG